MSATGTETESYTVVDPWTMEPLATDPRKREVYRYDPYMREGLMSFSRMEALGSVRDHTFVVLKPDAIAGRRCGLILDTLAEEGWHPVAATTVLFSPLLTRELWRYQFNAASEQRIAVVDHLLGSGRSLLVLLEDANRPAWLPASVRLTRAKGAADPTSAGRADLRTRIGRVNGLFNFMHTADDPADLIRETQLFSYQTGWAWCAPQLAAPALGDPARRATARAAVTAHLAGLESEIPAHDLDVTRSLARLAGGRGPWADLAVEATDRARIGDWLEALRRTPLPDGTARWDVLSVVTAWIECNEPGVTPFLPTGRADDWRTEGTYR
ncbi:hypothetical protein AB0G77_38545 [Streptomyces hygroscopicus]|uniref:nucleoside-diphosphate kinase n=1 Tax=Streptomyces hygroscopicus TaxID=1912 RepID=UPI0033EA11C3